MPENLSLQGLVRRSAAVHPPLKKLPEWNTPAYKALPPELKEGITKADHFNGINSHAVDAAVEVINSHGYRSHLLSLEH